MGFAFQQSFAPSHCFCIDLTAVDDAANETTAIRIAKRADDRGNLENRDQGSSSTLPLHIAEPRATSPMDVDSLSDVLYVLKLDAKRLKTFLENKRWLDKSRRMTTNIVQEGIIQWLAPNDASNSQSSPVLLADCVAVPVLYDCVALLPRVAVGEPLNDRCDDANDNAAASTENEMDWTSWLVGYGKQICPPCSGRFARHTTSQKNRKAILKD